MVWRRHRSPRLASDWILCKLTSEPPPSPESISSSSPKPRRAELLRPNAVKPTSSSRSEELHEGIKKSGIMGLYDPCPGDPNLLLVEYTFHGQKYKVMADDYDALLIPQVIHQI